MMKEKVTRSFQDFCTPILQLPTDILSIIFEECSFNDPDGNVMTIQASQWVLSQTCRSWRNIALSTSTLWKTIRIDRERYRSVVDPLSMLKTWLSRSQSTPISCSVDFPWRPTTEDQVIEAAIVDLIIEESYRWLDIFLELGFRPELYYRVGAIQRPLPLLRFFQISAHSSEAHPPQNNIFAASAFASAPNLTVAHLDVDSPLLPIPLPWHQLRRCRFFDKELYFKQTINLQNLIHLNLVSGFSPYSVTFVLPPSKLTLERLRRLEANFPSLQLVADLLDISFLPSLQDLKAEAQRSDSGAQSLLRSIVGLQSRSSCQLKRLNIAVSPTNIFSSVSSSELVRSLDGVEELHLSLRYHSYRKEDAPRRSLEYLFDCEFLPRLRALYFVIPYISEGTCPDEDTFFDEIADIVSARRGGGGAGVVNADVGGVRLERFSIDTGSSYDHEAGRNRKPRISVGVRGIRRIVEMEREGLVLLESVKGGWWCPAHERVTHWDFERVAEDARRFRFFGRWSVFIF